MIFRNTRRNILRETIRIMPSFFFCEDQTVILEANKRNVSLRVNSYLPNNAICKIECNFDNCQSDIEVRKDSEHYRTISKSFQSIFNRRKARIDDSGTYFCRLRGRNSQSDFTLNVLCEYF